MRLGISLQRGGVETPTSPLIVLRHAGKRLTLVTIYSDFFGRRGAPVSLPVTPERPITTIVVGICLSTADNCQTNCRAQPPESQLSWSGPTWSRPGQVCVNFVFHLIFPFVIEHSELFIRSQRLHA